MRNLTTTKTLKPKLILLFAIFLAFGIQGCQKSESEELDITEVESFTDSSTISAAATHQAVLYLTTILILKKVSGMRKAFQTHGLPTSTIKLPVQVKVR